MAFTNENKEKDSSVQELPNEMTKIRIIKNLIVIAIGFILLFIGYSGISMLQSTMNQEQGIGVVSQGINYAGFGLCALLLPKYLIKKLGCKKCLWMSMAAYIPYIASNFYPHWIAMAPSAVLAGFAAAILWGSQCTYYNEVSVLYSKLCVSSAKQRKNKSLHYSSSNGRCKVEIKISNASDSSENFENHGTYIPQTEFEFQTKTFSVETEQNEPKSIKTISFSVQKNLDAEHDHSLKDLRRTENSAANELNHYTNGLKCNLSVPQITESSFSPDESKHNGDAQVSNEIHKSSKQKLSKTIESITARFFGLFGLAYCSNHIWSNLMSFYVLQSDSKGRNLTFNLTCACGASFCNLESECSDENLAEPSVEMRYLLTGVSMALGILAVLIILLFVDDLTTKKEPVAFTFDMLSATCKFIKKKEQIFLIPLTMYIGCTQGFYIGDFTKSYIACAWGAYHVGLVTICYGLSSAFSSTLAGWLVKYVGRKPIFITTAFINLGTNAYLLLWNPDPNHPFLLFIAATLWGIIVGAFWSQLRAFYGVLFKKDEEAAFAGFYLWDSIGYCLAFSLSNYVCTYIKIYVLLTISFFGILGYLKVEYSHIVDKQ